MAKNTERGGGAPETAGLVTLPRAGKPPLRLKARPVDRLSVTSAAGTPLELALWARPGGGVALQYSRLNRSGAELDAVTLADRDLALREIERLCQLVARPGPRPKRKKHISSAEAIVQLEASFAGADDVRGFLVLAGEALDRWECPAPPGEH